ncbi:hypothetical protein Pla163_23470 [Planctomycetes bacterium Pla163]|uniref:HMA domain-containing protein n=1 Tax=Rohdeia mirabilis TaxID=2528008 RepID=A0A518D193_9BACT|nr:hypothetical protein Pla163_23470 [Planctomycetes bacterium Pla163]
MSCVAAVDDGLGRLEGVNSIHIDLQTNLVQLNCGPDVAMDLASVPVAIRETGFAPADLAIVANGHFEEGGRAFRPTGWSRALRVAADGFDAGVFSSSDLEGASPVHIAADVVGWEDGGELALRSIERR